MMGWLMPTFSFTPNSMARVRERINFVQTVNVNKIDVGSIALKAELMCLNFRKVLEEIAFSTLAANKDAYSELYSDFSQHWKAKAIVEKLKKLNPNFYALTGGAKGRLKRGATFAPQLRSVGPGVHRLKPVPPSCPTQLHNDGLRLATGFRCCHFYVARPPEE